MCRHVNIDIRASLLYKLVGQAMLFGSETLALTDNVCERLDAAFSRFLVRMMGMCKRDDESLDAFLIRQTSAAKR
eukprot:7185073-Karenia_brevis.AAC.1